MRFLIKFPELPDYYQNKCKPPAIATRVYTAISTMVYEYRFQVSTRKGRIHFCDVVNRVVYSYLNDPTYQYVEGQIPNISDDIDIESELGNLYLTLDQVDFREVEDIDEDIEVEEPAVIKTSKVINESTVQGHSLESKPDESIDLDNVSVVDLMMESQQEHKEKEFHIPPGYELFYADTTRDGYKVSQDRSDISLLTSTMPAIDCTQIYLKSLDLAGRPIDVYPTLPTTPTNQCEVSATTNIDTMIDMDFLKMFPDEVIRARHPMMYGTFTDVVNIHGDTMEIEVDEVLGYIPVINGYTREQIIDNIIKYPQFTYWYRQEGRDRTPFTKYVEIDGELVPRMKWLRESKDADLNNVPGNEYFIKDYMYRKYILDEEYGGIKHKYPPFGTYGPFMSLFMPKQLYQKFGYKDAASIGRQCVQNRIDFFRSRNPLFLMKKKMDAGQIEHFLRDEKRMCPFSSQCERAFCDYSCGKNVLFDVMMKKSEIKPQDVGTISVKLRDKVKQDLTKFKGSTIYITANRGNKMLGDIYAWLAACKLCPYYGSDVTVYHLKYSKYLEQLRQSWATKYEPEELIEARCFINTARVLIVSSLEYVQYKDFESQTLFSLLGERSYNREFTTIVIGPEINTWLGPHITRSQFANRLGIMLEEAVKEYAGK